MPFDNLINLIDKFKKSQIMPHSEPEPKVQNTLLCTSAHAFNSRTQPDFKNINLNSFFRPKSVSVLFLPLKLYTK